MAALPKALFRGAATLEASPVAVTVPAGKRWIVTNVILTNISTGQRWGQVNLDGFGLIYKAPLLTGGMLTLDCAQVLEASKIIHIFADATAGVHVHISGVEMDVEVPA